MGKKNIDPQAVCPKCKSKDIDLKWCENCFGTGVDSNTGDDCDDCEDGMMACNSCMHTWYPRKTGE